MEPQKPRILLVEDELTLQLNLSFILEREGYEVGAVSTGEEALARVEEGVPDLVLLDVNLPGIDGFEVCERLRARPATAELTIILLSGRTDVDDVVHGFASWADDYITKPFHPRILLARVNAALRRRRGEPGLSLGELSLDANARSAWLRGQPLSLTKTEFDLLLLFTAHPDRVFTRASILSQINGGEVVVTERTVDFQISALRKKLGPAAHHIETVRGVGYRYTT